MKKQSFNKRQNRIAFVISVFLISFCVLNPAFSQESEGNSYKAFMQKNPFLTTELYINNFDLIKGKVVKTTRESYDIDENGHKGFGDSDCPCVSYFYYQFNDEGLLESKYYLLKETTGKVLFKRKWQYSYSKGKYTVIMNDYKREEETKLAYKVSIKDDVMTLYCKNAKARQEETITVSKGSTIINEQRGDWDPTKREYIYSDDSCSTKFYVNDNLLRTMNFYRGKETTYVQEKYQETGKFVSIIDFNAEYTEGLSKSQVFVDGELSEESINSSITRKYSSAGFVEYESRKPYNQTVGSYSESRIEILDSLDDIINQEF